MANLQGESVGVRTPFLDRVSSRMTRAGSDISGCSACFGWLVTKQNIAFISGPLAALLIHFFYQFAVHSDLKEPDTIGTMVGILVWIASWWILAPIPLAITSLLPLVLFPLLGIMDSDEVSAQYTNNVVVLLLGTFILALAIQKYDLHKRIALKILLVSGGQDMNPRNVLFGFLAAAFFLSMWMSDTVAAVMMIPVALGVLNNLTTEESSCSGTTSSHNPSDSERGAKVVARAYDEESAIDRVMNEFGKGLVLAVTYGVGLGGMATLVGSGPNVALPGFYALTDGHGNEPPLTFLSWCLFSFPLLIPYTAILHVYLVWSFCPQSAVPTIKSRLNRRMVETHYEALGPMSFGEAIIVIEYFILIVLWITRIFGTYPGWGALFNNFPSDGTVALLAGITLFMIPDRQKEGEMIMDWKSCKELSWNVIFLIGGGFALSKGIQDSGLAKLIGLKLQFLEMLPYYLLTPVVSTILSIVTEFSPNVSVASLFVPILGDIADGSSIHPLLLMVPGTFACNFSFNLPSATPPNAVALASGRIKVSDMVYPGLFMHLVGIVLISILLPTLGAYVFELDRTT